MKKQIHFKLASLFFAIALLGLSANAALACASDDPTSPHGIVPTLLSGNPELCAGGVRFDPPVSGTFPLGTGSVTITISDTDCGQVFSWSVSGGIIVEKVIAKGGNDANEYIYNGQNSDGNLHSPLNPSGDYADLSHIDFCFSAATYQLTISKNATRQFERTYLWNLEKECLGPNPLVLEEGETYEYSFRMNVGVVFSDKNWKAIGEITIKNESPLDATITSVTDMVMPDSIPGVVTCPVDLPYLLLAGETLVCTYVVHLPDGDSRVNTATVTTSTPNVLGGAAEANINFVNPTVENDECVSLWDECNDENPMTIFCYEGGVFDFSCELSFDQCGPFVHTNTANLLANDSKNKIYDSCSFDVEINCDQGCTRTIGYWKTHSSYGPAPYDPTWALVGEDTPFFLSGQTYYKVMWTPSAGNAYYILAPQYVAALLNQFAGANIPPAVLTAFNTATTLLQTYTPMQVKAMKGNHPVRKLFISVAGILDEYNNGITGPGHCAEDKKSAGFASTPDDAGDIQLTAQPNPFAGEAQFTLSVPYDGPVTLDVFNAGGQRVATLFSGYLSADEERTVNFEAGALPEGLYIYRLTTDREVRTGQVVSMK